MQLTLKSLEDLGAGLIFMSLGGAAIWLARDYPLGEAFGMGPGFFPIWLGVILVLFGLAIAALSFRMRLEPQVDIPWAFRPWLILPGSITVFGLLMMFEVGFVPALLALIVGCSAAHGGMRPKEMAIVAVGLTALCVAIFIYGLGLPYRLFWWSN